MIPDEDAVTITFATLKAAVEAAEARERDRIISLLESEKPCRLKGTHHDFGLCSCLAIAIIKGEN